MEDPSIEALKKAFQSVFQLSVRHGKFIYPEIRKLKQALYALDCNDKRDFIQFLKILRTALPRIGHWRLDFNTIKIPMDSLAQKLNLPVIDWHRYLANSNSSPNFQFRALDQKMPLLQWLIQESKASSPASNAMTQTSMLLKCYKNCGFSKKLTAHLEKEPDFLFQLIIQSEEIFTQITNTRLILYLTDVQLAKAIIKHIPQWVNNKARNKEEAEKLVNMLNGKLSKGRSIETLLRNADAKAILDSYEPIKLHQQDENKSQPSSRTQ